MRSIRPRWMRSDISYWVANAGATASMLLVVTACQGSSTPFGETANSGQASGLEHAMPIFEDIAPDVGLDFEHFNGMTGDRSFVEMMGSGVALLDYDRDGDLDAYLVQGRALMPHAVDEAIHGDRLYRNELISESGGADAGLRFTDVTESSGLRASEYGMAVAVGDVDRDGWPDLYIANWGPDQLWRNNGDGSFSEIGAQAGIDIPTWSSGASFVDYDRDGWQDLFVVGYSDYDEAKPIDCYSETTGERDYCSPSVYSPIPDRLLRNLGDGRFEDVTASTGITRYTGHGLGIATADFDGDGWTDIYVANDGDENQLWLNRSGQAFENIAALSGSAVNMEGNPEASMGVSVEDFDADGDPDIFLTHLRNETNTLYLNDGRGFFEDASRDLEIAGPSHSKTAFGVAGVDLENDGWLDLVIANGAVTVEYDQVIAGDPLPLRQTNQLLRNVDGTRFEDVSAMGGSAFEQADVHRGLAAGDIDNDGDLDVLIGRNNGRVMLLRNRAGQDGAWIGVQFRGSPDAYDQTGVRSTLRRQGRPDLVRWSRSDGSYASASDARVIFGLGEALEDSRLVLEVTWPDGGRERWVDLEPERYHVLVRGDGEDLEEASP